MKDLLTLPKIENHLHLEGAIPLDALWQLIQKYGGDPDVTFLDDLHRKFVYRDFMHFLEMWMWKNQFIREYEDFTFFTDAVMKDLIRQHVKYAEIFISPSLFKKNIEIQRVVEAIAAGVDANSSIKVNLIVDLVRNYGAECEMDTLYAVNEVKSCGVIGIGIGGAEKQFPPELFVNIYEQARKFGFRTTAHAGEAAGPESIWGAVGTLKAERIGHGTRAIEDKALMQYLAEHKISVELCPLSNVKTRVISSVKEHPIKTFLEMGIPVSINTDDPKMFGNSLDEEYQTLMDTFGFSYENIQQLIIDSIQTTWLEQEQKDNLVREFMLEMKK